MDVFHENYEQRTYVEHRVVREMLQLEGKPMWKAVFGCFF